MSQTISWTKENQVKLQELHYLQLAIKKSRLLSNKKITILKNREYKKISKLLDKFNSVYESINTLKMSIEERQLLVKLYSQIVVTDLPTKSNPEYIEFIFNYDKYQSNYQELLDSDIEKPLIKFGNKLEFKSSRRQITLSNIIKQLSSKYLH
jgi:hypothetical protein